MRLSDETRQIISDTAREVFGPDARVWLFGSRLDNQARGGDIDLLLECPDPLAEPAWLAATLSARLERRLDGRKVDVLLAAPNLERLPIHDVALSEGQRL